MRLAIKLEAKNLKLPSAYKHIIQGMIYNMLDKEKDGMFYHDHGYEINDKKYKMFVFSDLHGKYTVSDKQIIFNGSAYLYIGSIDNNFIKAIYSFLMRNQCLVINKQKVDILDVNIQEVPIFNGEKDIKVKTLSPVVAYQSKNHYFTYYKPSDELFSNLVLDNIRNKIEAYHYPKINPLFQIKNVNFEKKKLVYFKNTFYEAYQCELIIHTNYETFKLIYDTGLSAKGPCGFGMVVYK